MLFGDPAGLRDRVGGEVDPHGSGPGCCQVTGVGADVALRMDDLETVDRGHLPPLEILEASGVIAVQTGLRVQEGSLVPPCMIERSPVSSTGIVISHAGSRQPLSRQP